MSRQIIWICVQKIYLKTALQKFTGTLILVSHDREFLDGLIDNVYEFQNHKIKKYIGNIYDFLQKKKIDSLHQLEVKESKSSQVSGEKTVSQSKGDYIKKKEINKNIRIHIKKISACENSIEELEGKLDKIAKELESLDQDTSSGTPGDKSLFIKYGDLKKELDQKMIEWEKLHSEFEKLKKSPYYK